MVRSESMMNVIKNIKPDTEDYATLCGGIVSANYGDHQFYRVSEIDYSVTPLSTFTVTFGKEAGKEQTYMDYYK